MPNENQPELPATDSKPDFEFRFDGSAAPSARRLAATAQRSQQEEEPSTHPLTVLIPARDEAHNLPGCLDSLLQQSEPGFELGRDWHIFVIDDGSTDGMRGIAERYAAANPGLHVLHAKELTPRRNGFTGKNAALWFGASQDLSYTAKWLLFTDADTLHEPGSTSRAIIEAERHDLGLLSYSPRQIAANIVQRALLPLIFSELASTYPPKKIADPSSPIAAANGQFLLVRRQVYFDMGGHQAVASAVLEDVALARLVKRRSPIKLRYAPEAVSARMYRSTADMMQGWTKNLALLFGSPVVLALGHVLNFLLILGLPVLPFFIHNLQFWQILATLLLWIRVIFRYFTRVGRSGAPVVDRILSVLALPLFAYLLIRSWQQVTIRKSVTWKGREYTT